MHRRHLVTVTLAVTFAILAMACGDSQPQAQQDQQCFSSMTMDQKAQLQQYVASQGSSVSSISNNTDGTQNVCVLEANGSGSMQAHYYNQNDQFGDYLLYAMLTGQGHTLATYGLLTGQLDVGQALALSLLTGMGSDGSLYHPYTYGNGGWSRQRTVINNVHVTYVDYGHQRPVNYSTAYRSGPPRGYSYSRLPNNNGQSATLTKSSAGRSTISSTKPVSSSSSYSNSSGSSRSSSSSSSGSSRSSSSSSSSGSSRSSGSSSSGFGRSSSSTGSFGRGGR